MDQLHVRLTVVASTVLLAGLIIIAAGQGPGALMPWARGIEGPWENSPYNPVIRT